jgi:hypothetical protein
MTYHIADDTIVRELSECKSDEEFLRFADALIPPYADSSSSSSFNEATETKSSSTSFAWSYDRVFNFKNEYLLTVDDRHLSSSEDDDDGDEDSDDYWHGRAAAFRRPRNPDRDRRIQETQDRRNQQVEQNAKEACDRLGVDFKLLASTIGGHLVIEPYESENLNNLNGYNSRPNQTPFLSYWPSKVRVPYRIGSQSADDRDDQWEVRLFYPNLADPVYDLVSLILEATISLDLIGAESLLCLAQLGLPLDRAEHLKPGLIDRYKSDLDLILLDLIGVSDLVWLTTSYLPGYGSSTSQLE